MTIGAPGFRTSQVTVDTTVGGVKLCTSVSGVGRHAVTVINLGTVDVYVGPKGVTTANGALLVGVKGASITINTQDDVYGITASSQAVSVLETY